MATRTGIRGAFAMGGISQLMMCPRRAKGISAVTRPQHVRVSGSIIRHPVALDFRNNQRDSLHPLSGTRNGRAYSKSRSAMVGSMAQVRTSCAGFLIFDSAI